MKSLTEKITKWIGVLTKDICENKEKVLEKVKDFPGDQNIITYAIEDLEKLPKNNIVGQCLVDFIEWYSTGVVSGIKVELNEIKR